jgi:hypothetical protein
VQPVALWRASWRIRGSKAVKNGNLTPLPLDAGANWGGDEDEGGGGGGTLVFFQSAKSVPKR